MNGINTQGISLPPATEPVGNYTQVQKVNDLYFFSGVGPSVGTGILGKTMTLEDGYQAARRVGLNLLGALYCALDGDWAKLEKVIKVNAFVRCTDDFYEQSKVIDGLSDLFVEVLGEKGKHARTDVGTIALPFGIPLEAEMIVEVKSEMKKERR